MHFFAYSKNMKSIQRVVDTRELVTRLYAVGAEGMTFADINGGKAYVEDFTYTNEVRISTLDCSSFTNPYQMKEYAEMRLADYAKPTISYVLNAMDLSVLTGYEHEAWELGTMSVWRIRNWGFRSPQELSAGNTICRSRGTRCWNFPPR